MFEGLGSTSLTNKSHMFFNQKPHVFFKKMWQDIPEDSLGMSDTLDYGEGDGQEDQEDQEDDVDTAVDSVPLALVPDDWLEDDVAGDDSQEGGKCQGQLLLLEPGMLMFMLLRDQGHQALRKIPMTQPPLTRCPLTTFPNTW